MGVRAYGRETLASLPIDVDKNWNDRSISNVNSLQANEHITVTARGANRKLYPALNRYDSETDGWYVSKDNNDIERKFWKDDFSVDSSDRYETANNSVGGSVAAAYDSANQQMVLTFTTPSVNTGGIWKIKKNLSGIGEVSARVKFSSATDRMGIFQIGLFDSNNNLRYGFSIDRYSGYPSWIGFITPTGSTYTQSSHSIVDEFMTYSFVVTNGVLRAYHNGSLVYFETDGFVAGSYQMGSGSFEGLTFGIKIVKRDTATSTQLFYVNNITLTPSISYSDDFSSDTVTGANGRYTARDNIGTTLTYDTDHINLSALTTSSYYTRFRLNSYRFGSGCIIANVTQPSNLAANTKMLVNLITSAEVNSGSIPDIGIGVVYDGSDWKAYHSVSGSGTTGSVVSIGTGGFYIDVERDTERGVIYYYIYESTKPITPTGKIYTTITQEVYFSINFHSFYNGMATMRVNNISIRAESIVGRTNVEVTEPFWFRDEFTVDSEKLWVQGTGSSHVISNGVLTFPTARNWSHPTTNKLTGDFTVRFGVKLLIAGGAYGGILVTDTTSTYDRSSLRSMMVDSSIAAYVSLSTGTITIKNGALESTVESSAFSVGEIRNYTLTYDSSTKTASIYDGSGVLLTSLVCSNFTVNPYFVNLLTTSTSASDGENIGFDFIEISGTRVYNKPIHRGAMLEIYHDGTQEVVGTTFIDDCQWDRSAEWTSNRGTWTHDPITGVIRATAGIQGLISYTPKGITFNEGVIDFDLWYHKTTEFSPIAGIIIFTDGNSESTLNGISLSNTSTLTCEYVDGVKGPELPSVLYDAEDVWAKIRVVVNSSNKQIVVYRNGTQIWSRTYTLTPKCYGISLMGYNMAGAGATIEFRNLVVNGVSVDATNGIAACIPPIGGGARYGEQEKVYKQLVNAAKFGEYKTTASIKTTNADAEAIEMYFKNITDTTNVTTDDTDTLAISLSDTNYATSTKDLQLLHGDRNDTIEVAVRKTAAATPVSPACYITDLMILPKTEG